MSARRYGHAGGKGLTHVSVAHVVPRVRHNGPHMPGFAIFFGDHLARSVRGVPGAPPA